MTLDEARDYTLDLLDRAKANDSFLDLDADTFMEANVALRGAVRTCPQATQLLAGLDLVAELVVW